MTERLAFHGRQRHRAAILASVLLLPVLIAATPALFAQTNSVGARADACTGDNGGVTLSPSFCATIFADNLGHARHMVFAPNGVLYVNTWSGRY
jgi:hypothetical protein